MLRLLAAAHRLAKLGVLSTHLHNPMSTQTPPDPEQDNEQVWCAIVESAESKSYPVITLGALLIALLLVLAITIAVAIIAQAILP